MGLDRWASLQDFALAENDKLLYGVSFIEYDANGKICRVDPARVTPVLHPTTTKETNMLDMSNFDYDHLPAGPMQDISRRFHDFARELDRDLPSDAEKSAGMRKLLEAKDCMVRSARIGLLPQTSPFEGENAGQHPRPS